MDPIQILEVIKDMLEIDKQADMAYAVGLIRVTIFFHPAPSWVATSGGQLLWCWIKECGL